MDFRDLQAFKPALLAKQTWKIITKPHSLLSQAPKAKYFPQIDPWDLHARIGISYVWRSLLHGFQLTKQGLKRRVEDRLCINMWKDPWIPKPYFFKPQPYNQYLTENLRVTNLISWKPRRRNTQVLQYFFLPHDVQSIQEIPLCQDPGPNI